jgi:hypothetical protein
MVVLQWGPLGQIRVVWWETCSAACAGLEWCICCLLVAASLHTCGDVTRCAVCSEGLPANAHVLRPLPASLPLPSAQP